MHPSAPPWLCRLSARRLILALGQHLQPPARPPEATLESRVPRTAEARRRPPWAASRYARFLPGAQWRQQPRLSRRAYARTQAATPPVSPTATPLPALLPPTSCRRVRSEQPPLRRQLRSRHEGAERPVAPGAACLTAADLGVDTTKVHATEQARVLSSWAAREAAPPGRQKSSPSSGWSVPPASCDDNTLPLCLYARTCRDDCERRLRAAAAAQPRVVKGAATSDGPPGCCCR